MQLAVAGKIKLTDNASDYLDGLPFDKEIKIYQLLSHTSGISNPTPLKWGISEIALNIFNIN